MALCRKFEDSKMSQDVTPMTDLVPCLNKMTTSNKIQMKKEIGVLEGVAIIMGVILGSGTHILYEVIVFFKSHSPDRKWNLYFMTSNHICVNNFLRPLTILLRNNFIFRYLYLAGKCIARSRFNRFYINYMDSLWFVVHDWRGMLCRIGH